MAEPAKARLEDVINYKPDQYLSEEEMKIIKDTFKDNRKLLGVLRKIFMPTINDAALPVEEFGKDMWFVGVDWSMFQAEEVKAIVLAREIAIKFICGGFISLKQIANISGETPMEAALRRSKDSTK